MSLANLVQNAADALNGVTHPEIKVGIKSPGEAKSADQEWYVFGRPVSPQDVVIQVQDNGCGMDADTMERSFDPCFTTKPGMQGFGLSKTLGTITGASGTIRCRSTLDSGTTIQLVLPEFADCPVATRTRLPKSEGEVELHNKNILVVDDEESVRKSTKLLLECLGWNVRVAESPGAAIEILKDNPEHFQVLLTDYSMPGMSGVELLRQVRSLGIGIRAVICSGYVEEFVEGDGTLVRNQGFQVLHKPFSVEELKEALCVQKM